MRLSYHGNHIFALPKKGGGVQSWSKGQNHLYDDEMWDKFKEREDIKFIVKNKLLIPSELKYKEEEKKIEEIREERKSEEPPQEAPCQMSVKDSLDSFLKLPYKTAIKQIEECSDQVFLKRLSEVEKRPSVMKALEAKLS